MKYKQRSDSPSQSVTCVQRQTLLATGPASSLSNFLQVCSPGHQSAGEQVVTAQRYPTSPTNRAPVLSLTQELHLYLWKVALSLSGNLGPAYSGSGLAGAETLQQGLS